VPHDDSAQALATRGRNDTRTEYERDASVPELFERRAAERPDGVAVELGDARLTYAQLDAAGNRVASRLRGLGVGRGDMVGVAAERSIEAVAAFLGVLKAGAAYVPLDPRHPPARLALMLEDTGARVVLAQAGAVDALARLVDKAPTAEGTALLLDPDLSAFAGEPDDRRGPVAGPRDLLYVLYTSGSTGRPKGVAVEHRSLLRLIRGAPELMPGPDDAVLLVNQLGFDVSAYDVWAPLVNGARVVVHSGRVPDPVEIGATIRRGGVTVAFLATGLLHQLVEGDLGSLAGIRLLMAAGDVLSPRHAARVVEELPGCRLVNAYGPTEATVVASWHEVRSAGSGESVPIGRPLPNTSLHLLDDERRPIAAGEIGELWIGGEGVARGYLGLPELTAERFVPDPFADEPGARLYRTGDRARLRPDGELEFLGRLDDQVKVRGYRVEPGEVEAEIAAHPDVRQAVVVARAEVPGHTRLVAYVALERGSVGDVRAFAAERLPNYMVPATFVGIQELPLTATGKVDRQALPVPGRSRSPGGDRLATEIEERVAAVWSDVLRVEHVRPDDDFFELGGDSLLALEVLARLRAAEGVELPLGALFDAPTVSGLAAELERAARDGPPASALPPLRPIGGDGSAPVSFAQAQACFFHELEPDALPYQFQALLRFDGELDGAVLERALTEIVRRHEILRTTFPKRGGEWVQMVHEPFAVRLDVVDVRAEADPEAALQRLARIEYGRRIELDRLPLVRWALVRVADDRHVLVHVEHHVVHDGWSFAQLLRELTVLYAAFAAGRPSPLPEPAVQYRDFAAWQRRFAESDVAREQLRHWAERLADPPPLALPLDRPRRARQGFRGASRRWAVPAELADRLRALAAAEGATPYMAMLTAFLVQLRRYGDRDDLVVGAGLANRRVPGSEGLIGMLVNTVALRVDLGGDPTVRELLRRVRAVALDAYRNQEIPFERVVKALAPARSADANPLYQALFSFHDSPLPDLRLPGLTIEPEEVQSNGSAKADVNVVVIDRRVGRAGGGGASGDLTVVWEYDSDLFDAGTAARMVEHYGAALAAVADDPERRVSELELLPEAERERLLDDLEPAPVEYEREASIAEVFAARVAERPDAVALVEGELELGYAELDGRAERLAARLRAAGVDRGARVGVCLERGVAMVVSLLAILKAGGAYVALDPTLPPARLRLLADDAGLAAICMRASLPEAVAAIAVDDVAGDRPRVEAPAAADDDLAYVAYTSGSTGRPKGVAVTQRGVVRLARTADYVELGPGETLLALAPLAFDASTFEIWGALLNGGRLVIAPAGALSPAEIGAVVRRHGVTTLWLTAGLFHQLVDHEPGALAGVRQLLAGGDVLSPAHVERALQALPEGAVLVNGYGPTEGTTFTACHVMRRGDPVESPVPIGRPIPATRAYVLDERRRPVPIGVAGELYVGGDGVARGYLGDPGLTAERFVPDPFAGDAGARMYRSGDRARWRSDGRLEFLGRADRQVKVRGVRVEPGEVEHALAEHPAVRAAGVTAVDFGPRDRRLVAYVVPSAGAGLDEAELRRFLADRLPAQLVPAQWVALDELPLTANGKLDRGRLPAPERRWRDAAEGGTGRPASRLERRLLAIWQDVLGIRPIGVDDDFFQLGGHSLLAVELFAAIERETGARLPLATIFEAPTVARLARALREEGWEAPWSSLVPLTTTGHRTPLFFVTAGDGNTVGFGALARRLGPEQPFYALQPRGLDGRRPLHRSVERIARHYLREVRSVQPHGPYLLGGRCLGGLVAFEMARRLAAAGERVALVAVLDSLGPRSRPRRLANGLPYDEVMSLARVRAEAEGGALGDPLTPAGTAALLEWLAEPVAVGDGHAVNRYLHEAYRARPDVRAAYPDLEGGDTAGLIDWAWTSGWREMGMARELLPAPVAATTPRPARGDRGRAHAARLRRAAVGALDVATRVRLPGAAARREEQLRATARTAAERYRAGAYPGRVTLIRSGELADDALLARWHEVAAEVDERTVDGSHRSMLREPDVASLARCLADCAEEALAAESEAGR
jgi:amino acid adenylation domain-containing protein